MRKLCFVPIILICLMATSAFRINISEEQFVLMASSSNSLEIALGGQAQQKGKTEAVKMFGKKMSEDHGKAGAELTELARSKGWTVPKELQPAHQEELDKLTKLSGEEFDREFAKAMLKSHQEAVALFENAAADGSIKDEDLRRWASQKLPTLKAHLAEAEKLVNQVTTK